MALRSARAGYRQLMRTASAVFREDVYALSQAKIKLREEFMKHKDVSDEKKLDELFSGIEEVDEMLRFNIVQGKLNDRGNYDVRLTPENQVTVDARQDLPGGAELEPVDKSILGQEIKIEKVSNSKK